MKTFFAIAPFLVAASRAAVIDIASTDLSAFSYTPNDNNWSAIAAPGAFQGNSMFLLGTARADGVITFAPSQPFTDFVFFGYQRSDGGIYGITFDGADASRIDVYNKTAQGGDLPLALFTKSGLKNVKHKVVITNLKDTRVGQFGQMNIDHVEISTAAASSSTTSSTTSAPPPPTSASSVPPASLPPNTDTPPPSEPSSPAAPSGPVAPVPSSPNGDDDNNSTSPATNAPPNHATAFVPGLNALSALAVVAAVGLFL